MWQSASLKRLCTREIMHIIVFSNEICHYTQCMCFCVACPLQRRRHIGITIRRLASSASASQKNFCHIFLGNHTGPLPDIWHRASVWRTLSFHAVLNLRHVHFLFDRDFEYCGHRQICTQDNFCHIFVGNHRGQLPDILHRASTWSTVSCNAFLNLRHVHFLFDATFNI